MTSKQALRDRIEDLEEITQIWQDFYLSMRSRKREAEKERDDVRESLREANETVKSLRAMTAREHLDAAWDAAYVPEDGIIPAGAAYISRHSDGEIIARPNRAVVSLLASGGGYERRILDAPEPEEPEPARPVVTEEMVERAMDRFCELDSDHDRSIWDCIEGALTAALAEEEEA